MKNGLPIPETDKNIPTIKITGRLINNNINDIIKSIMYFIYFRYKVIIYCFSPHYNGSRQKKLYSTCFTIAHQDILKNSGKVSPVKVLFGKMPCIITHLFQFIPVST